MNTKTLELAKLLNEKIEFLKTKITSLEGSEVNSKFITGLSIHTMKNNNVDSMVFMHADKFLGNVAKKAAINIKEFLLGALKRELEIAEQEFEML